MAFSVLLPFNAARAVAQPRSEPTLVATANISSEEPDEPIPGCTTEVRLSGTLYDGAHPERSFALLHLDPKFRGQVYREGAVIQGLAIESIEPEGVLMRDQQGLCWLKIMRAPGKKQPPRARAREAPRHFSLATAVFSTAELERAIHPTGTHAYDVERSLVERAVARAAQLARSTRVVQVWHSGVVAGLELRSLAKNGLLAHLGLRRGDLMKSLNGVALSVKTDSMTQKLIASAPRLNLLVMREGQALTLGYHVLD